VDYHHQLFLVDAGLFQGPKELRLLNWEPWPLASKLSGVIITHAHIDHCGYLPKLVKDGYRGPIYATSATCDLLQIMLMDAAFLQEEDARYANKTGHSKHQPALPLFDQEDAKRALQLLYPLPFGHTRTLTRGLGFAFHRAGHILGSAWVQLTFDNDSGQSRQLVFSGDIGSGKSPLSCSPERPREADYVVMESTYGDRVLPDYRPQALAEIVNKVLGRGGTLIIPAFALGRSQEFLHYLGSLEQAGLIPAYPVYMDSPMARDVTDIYVRYQDQLQVRDLASSWPSRLRFINDSDDSMLLAMSDEPKIVLSASGMLQGGRVLHHLKAKLPQEKNGVLFVGYQAQGTKGRLLREGISSLRIHHKEVSVEAEIFALDPFSAHADRTGLVSWLQDLQLKPQKVFLIHGETEARATLAKLIEQKYAFSCVLPKTHDEFVLS